MASRSNEMKKTLSNASKKLEKSLKKHALPAKDTGALDASIKSKGYDYVSTGKMAIKAEVINYGKYVNANKKSKGYEFIPKAIDDIRDDITADIVKQQIGDLMAEFKIRDIKK